MSQIQKDILYTILAQGVVAGALFLQYRIVSATWGVEVLSNYTFLFRVRGAIEWIVVLLIPLALTRQLSAAVSRERRTELAVIGMPLTLLLVALTCAALLAFPQAGASLLFGQRSYAGWVTPFCALLAAYCMSLLATGVLRGIFAFREASLLAIISIALIPAACLLLGRDFSITGVVTIMGVISTAATLAGLGLVLLRRRPRPFGVPKKLSRTRFLEGIHQLCGFGAPRLITLAASALFVVSLPWLMARENDAALLANLNVMMALLAAAALITSPVGFVLLPHLSRSLAVGERSVAAEQLRKVCAATVFAGVVCSALAIIFMQDALDFMLGQAYREFVALRFAVALALPCFLIVDVLRSVLDAASRFPLNALVYLAGLVATVAVFLLPVPITTLSLVARGALALDAGYLAAAVVCLTCAAHCFEARMLVRADWVLIVVWLATMLGWFSVTGFGSASAMENRLFGIAVVACCAIYLRVARPKWAVFIGGPFAK